MRQGFQERCLYIKDHLPLSALDRLLLTGLDMIGNVPFGGMVAASYLSPGEWRRLAEDAQFTISAWDYACYRSGPMRLLFPNRLEVSMKWTLSSRC